MANAAILLDLEELLRRGPAQGLAAELGSLTALGDELTVGRRRVSRRAYADYTTRRADGEGGPPPGTPALLVEHGIDPVQVFAGAGGGRRDALRLRIALDAGTLVERDDVDLLVLVGVDTTWIPAVDELRQRGVEVCAIGLEGGELARHCDRFVDLAELRDADRPDPGHGDDGTEERAYTLRPHGPRLYARLLRDGTPHLFLPSGPEWRVITDALFARAVTADGGREKVLHADLVERTAADVASAGVGDAERKVRAVAFLVFKAGCFVCRDGSAQSGRTDFHWSRPAVIEDEVEDAEGLRGRARLFVVRSLLRRLAEGGYGGSVDVVRLAQELEGGEPSEEEIAAAGRLLQRALEPGSSPLAAR